MDEAPCGLSPAGRFESPKENLALAKVDRTEPGPTAVADPPLSSVIPPAPEPPLRKFVPPPSRNLSIDELLEFWRKSAVDYGRRISGYLYRRYPIVNLRKDDPKANTNIAVLAEPPANKEVLLREYGTGEYKLILSDLDRRGRNGELGIAIFDFKESWVDFPPQLDVATVDQGHPRNRGYVDWLRNTGKLPPMNPTPPATNGTSDPAVAALASGFQQLLQERTRKTEERPAGTDMAFGKAIDMLSMANAKSIDMLLSQAKQGGPAELVDVLTKVSALMHGKDSGGDTKLMQMVLDGQQKNMDLIMKMIEVKTTPRERGDFFGELQKFAGAMTSMQQAFGGAGGGGAAAREPRTFWGAFQPFIPEALQTVRQVATALPFMFGRKAAASPMGNMPPQQGPMSAPPPGAGPMTSAGLPQPLPPSQPPPQAAPMPNGAPGPQQPQEQEQMDLQQFVTMIIPVALQQIQEGLPGQELAEFLIASPRLTDAGLVAGYTLQDHVQIQQAMSNYGGVEGIMRLLPMTPFWKHIGPIASRFRQYFIEFLSWEPGWDGGEEGGDEVPPPAAAGPQGSRE